MSVIKNERIKITANWINSIATACVTAGVVAPLVAIYYGFGSTVSTDAMSNMRVFLGVLVWFFAGLVIHLGARRMLKRIDV